MNHASTPTPAFRTKSILGPLLMLSLFSSIDRRAYTFVSAYCSSRSSSSSTFASDCIPIIIMATDVDRDIKTSIGMCTGVDTKIDIDDDDELVNENGINIDSDSSSIKKAKDLKDTDDAASTNSSFCVTCTTYASTVVVGISDLELDYSLIDS